MRLLLISLCCISSLYSFEYHLKPTKISSQIYCFFGEPAEINKKNNGNMVNSCFLDTGKSYIVIDSGPTYLYAKEATKIIQKIKNLPISTVINTHTHDDHWLGNGYYKEIGAKIIGTIGFSGVTKTGETRMQKSVSNDAYAGTEEQLPESLIDGDANLKIDGLTVALKVYPTKVHSQNDMTVSIPSLGVLFAGDLVFNNRVLSLRDGDIDEWVKTLNEIDNQKYRYIIGGHGTVYNSKSTFTTFNYLKDLRAYVQKSLDNGIDLHECIKSSEMPKYKNLKMYEMLHKNNVGSTYRALEWKND